MATLEETLRKLGLATARGVPQLATGFVDLAALPFTMTGMVRPEQVFGSTDYLTAKGLLPPPQQGLLSETTELVSGALNPATATKAALAKGGLIGMAGSIGAGLQKIRGEAKSLSEKQFLDKYVTQTMPEHLSAKHFPEGVASQKPHDFLPPALLEPSEWSSWSDRTMAGTPEKIKNFRSAMQKGDVFPPVLIHTRKGEFPSVEDGHHRVAAYLDEGAKAIPVSLDIDSLIKIWKEENKSGRKVSEIYQDYRKTLSK